MSEQANGKNTTKLRIEIGTEKTDVINSPDKADILLRSRREEGDKGESGSRRLRKKFECFP